MSFFYILEISITGNNLLNARYGSNSGITILNLLMVLIALGAFPILQAICLIWVKKTRDPLDGLSKLDFI